MKKKLLNISHAAQPLPIDISKSVIMDKSSNDSN